MTDDNAICESGMNSEHSSAQPPVPSPGQGTLCLVPLEPSPPVAAQNRVKNQAGKAGDSPEGGKLFVWFFLGLLTFALFLLYNMFRPFLDSIILACVFTTISYPFYSRCLKLTRNRKAPAAAMVLAVMLFLVILPI